MKKRLLMALSLSLVLVLSLTSGVFAVSEGSQNLVSNGDFETGDLTGWTVFQTSSNGVTNEGVAMFDTTGSGASNAAEFNVGQVTNVPAVYEGGGIYQTFNAPAGPWEVSTVAIAAWDQGTIANLDGGLFELLVDGAVVDSYDFGYINAGAVLRETLSATGSFASSGSHEVRIRITRPWTTSDETPNQYVDNVNLRMTHITVDKSLVDAAPDGDPALGGNDWFLDLNEKWYFTMEIDVINNTGSPLTDVVVKDNFGGDLEVISVNGVEVSTPTNKKQTWSGTGAASGVTVMWTGKTLKAHLTWDIASLAPATTTLTVVVATDVNPGQAAKTNGKNEYTSGSVGDELELNSGPTAIAIIDGITLEFEDNDPVTVEIGYDYD